MTTPEKPPAQTLEPCADCADGFRGRLNCHKGFDSYGTPCGCRCHEYTSYVASLPSKEDDSAERDRRATPDLSAMGGETVKVAAELYLADKQGGHGERTHAALNDARSLLLRLSAALTAQSAALAKAEATLADMEKASGFDKLALMMRKWIDTIPAEYTAQQTALKSAEAALLAMGCRLGADGWKKTCDYQWPEGPRPKCDGKGWTFINYWVKGIPEEKITCPKCGGTGLLPIVATPSVKEGA